MISKAPKGSFAFGGFGSPLSPGGKCLLKYPGYALCVGLRRMGLGIAGGGVSTEFFLDEINNGR